MLVTRPVWRLFDGDSLAKAAKFVRAGGHAVIEGKRVLLPPGKDGILGELTAWALLEMQVAGVRTRKVEPIEGLLEASIPPTERERVLGWCARDAEIKTAKTKLELDCKTCGACCYGSRVLVQEADLLRWKDSKRTSLGAKKFVHVDPDGNHILRHDASGHCVHASGTECTIYDVRPENCRAFPAGGNGCLSKRAARGIE